MNHQNIIIREAKISDAEALLALKKDYLKNTKSIPLYLDEYSANLDDEKELIQRFLIQKNSCLLVAENNDTLLGNIDLQGNQRRKLQHTAMIGMGIANAHQGKGIGTKLMQRMIAWACDNEYIEIIWLEVYDNNEIGKKLYQNAGFKECGRMKGFFKENGMLIDNIRMIKHLKRKDK